MKRKNELTFAEASRLFKQGRKFLIKTSSGNFVYYRNHWKGDIHLICKPFANSNMPLKRKEEINKIAGY